MTVTKDEIRRLKERPPPTQSVDLTPTGELRSQASMHEESQRQNTIQYGEYVLNNAVENFRNNMAFRAREGFSKAQFDKSAGQVPFKEAPQLEKSNVENFKASMKVHDLSRQYERAR